MFHDYLRGSLEALLFAAGEPLSVAKLAEIMQLDKPLGMGTLIAFRAGL